MLPDKKFTLIYDDEPDEDLPIENSPSPYMVRATEEV